MKNSHQSREMGMSVSTNSSNYERYSCKLALIAVMGPLEVKLQSTHHVEVIT